MSKRLALLLVILLVAALAAPAGAITNGQPDNGRHPQVGQLLFYDPSEYSTRYGDYGGWFNCSGTLLSATVVLTAGHCTYGVGNGGTDMWVSFQETSDYSMLAPSGTFISNSARYAQWSTALNRSASWYRGKATPHPQYNNDAFFLFDVGVVVLDRKVPTRLVPSASYGKLPAQGILDTKIGSEQLFTAVGFGMLSMKPIEDPGNDARYVASMMLISVEGVFGVPKGTSVKFSNNPGQHATGGTCFGDSGGPTFLGDTTTVVAVTSFGINPNCVGNGGGYRIDQPDDLNFIRGYLSKR
jgi:hypothetical protein